MAGCFTLNMLNVWAMIAEFLGQTLVYKPVESTILLSKIVLWWSFLLIYANLDLRACIDVGMTTNTTILHSFVTCVDQILTPSEIVQSFNLTYIYKKGTQWLSGRVLDSRPKGRGFEPHRRHCVVVLYWLPSSNSKVFFFIDFSI